MAYLSEAVIAYARLYHSRMVNMHRASIVFARIVAQNSHPLDRVEPGSVGPQVWEGDYA